MKTTKIGDHISVVQGKYDTVFVTRPSILSNQINTVSFGGVRYDDIVQFLTERFVGGNRTALIQDAFPQLKDAEREFLMTGITAEQWLTAFGDGSEEEESENEV